MGNAQSELTSEQPSYKRSSSSGSSTKTKPTTQTTIPLNDYDPNGAVIPDIPPMEVLRTVLQIEKFERCLSCVPLAIDPRSPRSQMMDSALAEATKQLKADEERRGGGSMNMGDVDVMSTIEEGDSESTSFQERQLKQQQQQQQQQQLRQQMYEEQRQQMYQERFQQEQEYHDHGDPWIPATFPKNDNIASQWQQHPQHHVQHQQQQQQHQQQQYSATVNKSTSTVSGEYTEFDPDKIIIAQDSENHGSAEYTEFDPDVMIAEEEEQHLQRQEQIQLQQQQQQQQYEMQQPIDSDELDDVMMMRSDDGDAVEERYQDTTRNSHGEEDDSQTKQPSQQIIGLTEPMEVAHRTTHETMNVKNSGERYQFLDQEVVHGYLQQENDNSQSHNDEQAEQITGSKKQHDRQINSQTKTKQQNDWRDNHHQLTIRTEVGDANKIANQHFDDIISDFEISSSPKLTPRENAYSNVRSWKILRAQKQRRNARRNKNDIISAENIKTPKRMYSPQTSSKAASFVARTTVGRKLNGISPKTMAALLDDYYDTPPSDEGDAMPEYLAQSEWKDGTAAEEQPSEDYSSSLYEGSDPATSSAIVESYSSAVMTEDSDMDEVVESYSHSSNQGNVPSADGNNVIDSTVNTSYSAEKTLSKSTEEEQKIVSDPSADSTVSSKTFEETHAKLKGLLRKNSYESESISDSINWDNLAYSISDGTPTNNKAGEHSFDEVLAARGEQSLEEEESDQGSPSLQSQSRKDDASSANDDNAITGEGMKDKIKQMKKQHEDEMKSYMDEAPNTPSLEKYAAVQKHIDAMRDQHKANIDNMRAALKETDDDRNPPESSRNEDSEPKPSTSSSRFNFDDTSIFGTRTKAIQELMAQNTKLEAEMKLIRTLSPRSPESFEKYSPKQYASSSRETFSRHKYLGYMSSIESPKSPESNSSGTDEAREALSTMIFDTNADDEQMNTRLNGMIADIKNFLQENDDLQERLSKDIMTYGV